HGEADEAGRGEGECDGGAIPYRVRIDGVEAGGGWGSGIVLRRDGEPGIEEGAVVVGGLDEVACGAEFGDRVEVVAALCEDKCYIERLILSRFKREWWGRKNEVLIARDVRTALTVVDVAPALT